MAEADWRDHRLVAMVRHPRSLFVYWTLPQVAGERLTRRIGKESLALSQWCLRIEAVEKGEVRYVGVDLTSPNWYLDVEPDTRYLIALGARTSSGVFQASLCADAIRTPPLSLSTYQDPRWPVIAGLQLNVGELGGYHLPLGEGPRLRLVGDWLDRLVGSTSKWRTGKGALRIGPQHD